VAGGPADPLERSARGRVARRWPRQSPVVRLEESWWGIGSGYHPFPMAEEVQTGPTKYLTIAGQEFRTRLGAIGADSWGLATPCPGWTVRDLVEHVVVGNQRAAYRLGGASRADVAALAARDLLGKDPLGAFDRTLAAQARAFAGADALERVCETAVGETTGRQLLGFRITDLVVHSWDLARATGMDECMDAALAEHTWQEIEPRVPMMASMGVFGDGPSGTLPGDAPAHLKLLDASGRRP
jgi:uncharacterized protein (TIGR03086 family)